MDIAAHPDAATLAGWDMPIDDVIAFTERVATRPRFEEAVRTLAGNMLALAAADRALYGVFKDAGRFVTALLAIQLDATGGVTLPALKDICARSGFLSPGRARAVLAFMRYLGYVDLLPVTRGREPARYRLTRRFVDSWRLYLTASLEAAEILEPGVGLILRAFDQPGVADAYILLHCETLFEVTREPQLTSAFVEVFLHRHAGTQLVHSIVLAMPEGDFFGGALEGFPLGETAKRLGVSRIHLRRVLDDGQRRGLLEIDAEGRLRLLDLGRNQLAFHYSMQVGRMLACAARTLKANPQIANSLSSPGPVSRT